MVNQQRGICNLLNGKIQRSYLFIYCHLYSAFSVVQCSNVLYRLWDGEMQGHTGQPSVWEIMHTLCTIQWATAPGWSLKYPRPKSITHLHTFSYHGVYVALQLFVVILVSDQWRRVFIPYSYRQAPWGLLHAWGWLSRYTWDQQLYVVSEQREKHSPMLKARFLHLTILVAAGIEPQTFWLPGQRVATRPRLSALKPSKLQNTFWRATCSTKAWLKITHVLSSFTKVVFV